MAWTLQPRSYMEAIRPNLYNLAYRRTGSYKGMGQVSTADLLSLPLTGPYTAPSTTLQTSAEFSPSVPSPIGLFIQQYGLYVIGGIAFLALLSIAGGRRR